MHGSLLAQCSRVSAHGVNDGWNLRQLVFDFCRETGCGVKAVGRGGEGQMTTQHPKMDQPSVDSHHTYVDMYKLSWSV